MPTEGAVIGDEAFRALREHADEQIARTILLGMTPDDVEKLMGQMGVATDLETMLKNRW